MMRPQRSLLWAALGVLVLTNAVALGGVAWNRSAPDSTLALSELELAAPWQGAWAEEDSGLRLTLQWRVPLLTPAPGQAYAGLRSYGPPAWLDGAKMRALGFPASALQPASGAERWRDPRREARDALVVLELAGPAWQQAQQQVQAHARELVAANADGRGQAQADQALAQEARASRLFAVDAGLDRDALRQRWPDRQRYAIVQARVAPWLGDRAYTSNARPGLQQAVGDSSGVIQSILADELAVPHAMRAAASAMTKTALAGRAEVSTRRHTSTAAEAATGQGAASTPPAWTATVAFGRRLEPWLVSVRPGTATPAGTP